MASGVRFGRFKWDRAGYAQLMNTSPVQSVIDRKARAVKAAADAAVAAAYPSAEGSPHEVKDFRGTLADGRLVRTGTWAAKLGEAKHKTLSKSLGAANG